MSLRTVKYNVVSDNFRLTDFLLRQSQASKPACNCLPCCSWFTREVKEIEDVALTLDSK